jgi:ribonuclease D
LAEISKQFSIPQENLISPDTVKRIIFNSGKEASIPVSPTSRRELAEALRAMGARNWQVELVLEPILLARAETKPPKLPQPEEIEPAESEEPAS